MKNLSLIASALAMLGLTACEKGLVDGVADVAPAGQAAKSVLQVRTRSGSSVGGEPAALNMSICNATTPAASNMSICNATTPFRKSGLQILILTAVGLQIRPSGSTASYKEKSPNHLSVRGFFVIISWKF